MYARGHLPGFCKQHAGLLGSFPDQQHTHTGLASGDFSEGGLEMPDETLAQLQEASGGLGGAWARHGWAKRGAGMGGRGSRARACLPLFSCFGLG